MQLVQIPVGDVYPDENNPRKDFGDLDALAASLALNETNPGEPVNPIVVVRDGGIYRIVDGERRWRAMRKAGTARCHAVACEGMDEANAMVAMLATDDKLELTEIERSRGVQQMLLLGVDPERVERAGRMARGSASKVRRARKAVDDAGDDMTLDRMIAIAEYDEKGDADAVARLASCREDEWQAVAKEIGTERKRAERAAAIRASLVGQGVEIVESKPAGYVYAGRLSSLDVADGVAERYEGTPIVAVEGSDSWNLGSFELYMDERVEKDAAELELDLAADDIMPCIEAVDEACLMWFDARMEDPSAMPFVMSAVEDAAEDLRRFSSIPRCADDYEQAVGHKVDRSPSPELVAAGYTRALPGLGRRTVRACLEGEEHTSCRFIEWMDWCRLFIADGMEMPIAWKSVVEFAKEHGIETEDEDESEEQR